MAKSPPPDEPIKDPSRENLACLRELADISMSIARTIANRPVEPSQAAAVMRSLRGLMESVRETAELANRIEASVHQRDMERKRHEQRTRAILAIESLSPAWRSLDVPPDAVRH